MNWEPIVIALITQAGLILVALIQTGRLRREQRQAREDRKIADATSDAQAAELALVEQFSPCSSPSCLREEVLTTPRETRSTGPTGGHE